MKSKSEELLYLLLWTAETLARPTFRALNETFEGWAYRNGLHRQLLELERHHYLEAGGNDRDRPHAGLRARWHRLTEPGRLKALGGRDPEAQWSRRWDGLWRFVIFDVPMGNNASRLRLRRSLRKRGFGGLQGSVWVSPDPVTALEELPDKGGLDVGSLLLVEGRPGAGESDGSIVQAAWDFRRINEAYGSCLRELEAWPGKLPSGEEGLRTLRRWAQRERTAWNTAAGLDPMLPRTLLPADYLGERAWQQRIEVLGAAGSVIRTMDLRGALRTDS